MKIKKGLTIIALAVAFLGVGLGGLSYVSYTKGNREFIADGYILDASNETYMVGDVNQQYYFSQGDSYREKYGTNILFKDSRGEKISVENTQFLHYSDGSLGAFTNGVVMDLSSVDDETYGYYNVSKKTVMVKNADGYSVSSRGKELELREFVWKISDTDYIYVSPEVTLELNESTTITLPDYAQIKYIDNGIVRIIHQTGTYQTVSSDSLLVSQNGVELNLAGKAFQVEGELSMSLERMSLDDESYIQLDEYEDNTPQIKLPTFQVINGKNGAAGADGESGEEGQEGMKGQIGEDGTDGEAGGAGGGGAAGATGENGLLGENGQNGLIGEQGFTGYDGASGMEGKDATNAESVTGIIGVDLNVRPTVTMDPNYEVTPGSIRTQLNLEDKDEALVPGKTEVKLFDRSTMQEVAIDPNLGQQLENTGSITLGVAGLAPDKEYLLIVSGQYVTEDSDLEGKLANLFTKIIKTDDLGIKLLKDSVTDQSIVLKSSAMGTAVQQYNVILYNYEEDGTRNVLAHYDNVVGSSTFTFDLTKPVDDIATGSGKNPGFTAPESNTTYYAAISNLTLSGGASVSTEGTEIEIKTLRKKPFKATDNTISIAQMQPDLYVDQKSRKMTVSLEDIKDPDNGIVGYRYELYKAADVSTILGGGSQLSDFTPAFVQDLDILKSYSFMLSADDLQSYCARVVVLFHDNEKEVEYATAFSTPASLTAFTFPVVEFVGPNPGDALSLHHDVIEGYVKIKDPHNLCLGYLGTDEIVLTISSEYEDVYTFTWNAATMTDSDAHYFYFKKTGLRQNTAYTLSVSGPVDTDGDTLISTGERMTYLSGVRATTTSTIPLRAAFALRPNATAAFSLLANITANSTATEASNAESVYEARRLKRVEYELYQKVGERVTKLGNTYVVVNEGPDTDGIFFNGGWSDAMVVSPQGGTLGGLQTATPNASTPDKLVLTPENFGLDNNDSVFFSGGVFFVKAVSGTDYTIHNNAIGFESGADYFEFEVAKKHVRAADSTNQITVANIYNEDLTTPDANLAPDTVVGFRLCANYMYSDVSSITYHVYELGSSVATPDTDTEHKDLYPYGTTGAIPAGAILLGDSDATLVCTGTYSPALGYLEDVTLLFSDFSGEGGVTWIQQGSNTIDRGKRYFVTYTVVTNGTEIDCNADGIADIYPDCTYNNADPIPMYRSRIQNLTKQVPVAERYPVSSTDDSITWAYRVKDPDKAFNRHTDGTGEYIDFIAYQYNNAGDESPTKTVQKSVLATDVEGSLFGNISFSSADVIGNGKYYNVEFPYKLIEAPEAIEQKLTSDRLKFTKLTVAPGDLLIKGMPYNATIGEANREEIGGVSYEKAISSEGGYRYKLTLRSNEINRIAALRVTFSGRDSASNPKTVIYDPVYPEIQEGQIEGTSYGYAYMDTGALSGFAGTVTVTAEAYYGTGRMGYDGFTAGATGADTLAPGPYFALKQYQSSDGASQYIRHTDSGFAFTIANTDVGRMIGSLYVPGTSGESAGLETTGSTDKLNVRYTRNALCQLGTLYDIPSNISLTASGVTLADVAMDGTIIPEKLELVSLKFKANDTEYTMNVDDIMPAVSLKDQSNGSQSASMSFDAKGVGADGAAIYPEIQMLDGGGNLVNMKVAVESVTEGGNTTKYYRLTGEQVNPGDYDTYYGQANYSGLGQIDVVSDGSSYIWPLKIRNLSPASEYRVRLFSYDSAGNRIYLYNEDRNTVGYYYTITTLANVAISVDGPYYQYDNYDYKYVSFSFAVPGDDGTGVKASYWITRKGDLSTNNIGDVQELPRRLEGTPYAYYDKNPANNEAMKVRMQLGQVTSGQEYTLYVDLKDGEGNSVLIGGVPYTRDFTPEDLKKPSLRVIPEQYKDGTQTKLKVSVTCIDNYRTISNANVGDTDATAAYGVRVALFDMADDSTPIKSWQFAQSTATTTHTSTGDEIFDVTPGKQYKVRVSVTPDLSNSGIMSTPVYRDTLVTIVEDSKATLGYQIEGTGAGAKLKISMDNVENFAGVDTVFVTVYDNTGVPVLSGTAPLSYTEGVKNYETEYTWGAHDAGKYTVEVQYRNGDVVMGNGSFTMTIASTRS